MARGLTLDSGALIAFEKGNRMMRAMLALAHDGHATLTVPAPVLAQVWRGNNPRIAILLKACVVESFDEGAARETGKLLGESRTTDMVDAAVVVTALQRQDSILTTDPTDIERLAAGRLRVVPL